MAQLEFANARKYGGDEIVSKVYGAHTNELTFY